jgi:hypothetical protein
MYWGGGSGHAEQSLTGEAEAHAAVLLVTSLAKAQALMLLDTSMVHSLRGRADIRRPLHHCCAKERDYRDDE